MNTMPFSDRRFRLKKCWAEFVQAAANVSSAKSQKTMIYGLVGCCLLFAATAVVSAQQDPPATGSEAELIAVLQSDAPVFDKAKACQQLAVTGTEKCVPVLEKLLADEKMAHYARFALEPNPAPAVDEAFRGALDTLDGQLLVGVINSIGARRDTGSMGKLESLLQGSEAPVAATAAAALGRMATPESAEILTSALTKPEPLRSAVADACLAVGDTMVKEGNSEQAVGVFEAVRQAEVPRYMQVAALAEKIRTLGADAAPLVAENLRSDDEALFNVGLSMAHVVPGDTVTGALISELENTDASQGRRAKVIAVLQKRGDKAALPAVLDVAKTGSTNVRLSAVHALAELGDASAVPLLLETALQSDKESLSEAALSSLAELPGEAADQQIKDRLAESKGQAQRVLVELVGLREITAAVPMLLEFARSDQPEISQNALAALGLTIQLEDLPKLVSMLVNAESQERAAVAKQALEKGCQRMPDQDATAAVLLENMEEASMERKSDLFDLLRVTGGDKALDGVAEAANSDDQQMVDAATRVLGKWMTPDAAPVLLKLAKSGPRKFRVRSLRGYIRIPRQLKVSADKKMDMAVKALNAATRDEERRLVIEDVLARLSSVEALELVMQYLESPGLTKSVCKAAVEIAQDLVKTKPAAVAESMPEVIAAIDDKALKQKAKRSLRRSRK